MLSVSARTIEWCTRCMSGVTSTSRTMRSSQGGIATLEWLNIEVALSTTSNTNTATGGMPNAITAAILIASEIRISNG